jgi:predicted MFS family arabinose efflux permease
MTDSGLSVTTATWVMSLLGPSLLVGRLGTGFLLDRWSSRAVCLTVVAFPVVTCLIMATYSGSVPLAILAIVCCGAAAGAEGDILAYFASRHFGLAHYGSIYGLMLGIFSIGFGSFPPIAGFVFDRTGSYGAAFWLFSGLLAIAVVLLLKAGDYPDEFAVKAADAEHDQKESRDDGAHTADPVRG